MAQQITEDEDYALQTYLLDVANILVKIRERELLSQKLSATAADILFLVKAMGEEVTPSKIRRMMLRELAAITRILVHMENQGLIKRTKNLERKNQVRITLTAKGEEARTQAMKKQGATGVIARLSAVQQKQLKTSLAALKEAGRIELRLGPKALIWP
jgi:DNA-binding MarR family transcriptional regulator